MSEHRTVSDLLIDTLSQWGVDVIFGLPGDGINGIVEALRTRQERIRFVVARHEEAALWDLAKGELPAEEAERVEAHLADCIPCTCAYEDVKDLGANASLTRTSDQTEAARCWNGTLSTMPSTIAENA